MVNMLQLQSSTQAMKAKKLLEAKGIRTKIVRISAAKSKNGCSYGLRIEGRNDEAVSILAQNGIKIVGRTFGGAI